jgi:hypothetical protein
MSVVVETEELRRRLPTKTIIRQAERAAKASLMLKAKADRLFALAYEVACERGEHIGDDPWNGVPADDLSEDEL